MDVTCHYCGKTYSCDDHQYQGHCPDCKTEMEMRDLVIEHIVRGFDHWLDELHINYTSNTPEAENVSFFVNMVDEKYHGKPAERKDYLRNQGGLFHFRGLLGTLSDRELLDCLDGQACQSYR